MAATTTAAAQLARLAPWPTHADESAEALILAFGARAVAGAVADDGTGNPWPGDPAVPWPTLAMFAAAHALQWLRLLAPGSAEMCAAEIVDSAADVGELADWLADTLGFPLFARARAIVQAPAPVPLPRTESE